MKKVLFFAILVMCICLVSLASAEKYVINTQHDPLLIRDAPHGGAVIGKIPKGTVVNAQLVDKYSALVTYKGVTGYIYAGYLKPYNKGGKHPSPESHNGSGHVNNAEKRVTLKGGYLNVRSGPGINNRSIGRLYDGDIVKVISMKNGWAKIKYKGNFAYVSAKYLK